MQNVCKFNDEPIKFVQYENFAQNLTYIKAKRTSKLLFLKSLSTSVYLILVLILSGFIVGFTGGSALFYISLILSLPAALFYPVIILSRFENFRIKYSKKEFEPKFKKRIIVASVIFGVLFVLVLIANLAIYKTSFSNMFSVGNFASFYAPLLIACAVFVDVLITKLLLKNVKGDL